MLRIYETMRTMLGRLRPVLEHMDRRDSDLARQLRRAAASVLLNTAEGMYSRGKSRSVRYHTALGSARETLACLEVAEALYAMRIDPVLRGELDAIVGTLVRLVA